MNCNDASQKGVIRIVFIYFAHPVKQLIAPYLLQKRLGGRQVGRGRPQFYVVFRCY